MRINYGINRNTPVPGKKTLLRHKNGHLEMDGDWNNHTFHGQIRQRIQAKHPGWSITGYAYATHTRTFEITIPEGHAYPLSCTTLVNLVVGDSMTLNKEDVQVKEVFLNA